jgi:hypothetical protein
VAGLPRSLWSRSPPSHGGPPSSELPNRSNPIEVYYDTSETPYLDAVLALEKARTDVKRLREGGRRVLYRLSVIATIAALVFSAVALSK